jgi:DNA gyrase subunit A
LGYIKRTPLADFRAQHRGGVGAKGSSTRNEDFIEHIYTANNRSYMLFFTERGRCYWLKVYNIPEGAKNQKGRAIQNLLSIESNDSVKAYISIRSLADAEFVKNHNLVFCTKKGVVKKTPLEAYSRPRSMGVNAIIIREDDELLQVELTSGNSEIVLANRNGRAIRFDEARVREMGRMSTGVRGMTLDDDNDEVVGMLCMEPETEKTIVVLSANGYGKRSVLDDYRITNRGGKGVKTISVTEKTGKLVAIKSVDDGDDLVIINRSGITLRLRMADIRIQGRATQGVRMINLEKRGDTIASVCAVATDPDEEAETPDMEPTDDAAVDNTNTTENE